MKNILTKIIFVFIIVFFIILTYNIVITNTQKSLKEYYENKNINTINKI